MIRFSMKKDIDQIARLWDYSFGYSSAKREYLKGIKHGRYLVYCDVDDNILAFTGIFKSERFRGGYEIDWTGISSYATEPYVILYSLMKACISLIGSHPCYCTPWRTYKGWDTAPMMCKILTALGFSVVVPAHSTRIKGITCTNKDCYNCSHKQGINCSCYEDLYYKPAETDKKSFLILWKDKTRIIVSETSMPLSYKGRDVFRYASIQINDNSILVKNLESYLTENLHALFDYLLKTFKYSQDNLGVIHESIDIFVELKGTNIDRSVKKRLELVCGGAKRFDCKVNCTQYCGTAPKCNDCQCFYDIYKLLDGTGD